MTDLEFWKGKKVLITGGSGFVGKNLRRLFDRIGVEYFSFSSKEYNLIDKEESERAFQTGNYDFIIHMATLQHAGDWPLSHTGEQFYVNGLIHLNCLEAWRKYQPQAKFIGVGSNCSYPGHLEIMKEEDYNSGELHESIWAYGFTKKIMNYGIEAYKKQYGLKGTTVFFATLYGPEDDFNLKTAHVVASLIRKFCDSKRDGLSEVEVWGDGSQTRELIYIDDQIEGLLMAAKNFEGSIVNIGTGIETSIKKLAETIKMVSGYEGNIFYNTSRFVGAKNKVMDISKAKDMFGWTVNNKMHSLEEGLRKTVEWYEKSQDNFFDN